MDSAQKFASTLSDKMKTGIEIEKIPKPLTSDERAELTLTESKVEVAPQEFFCVVHRGPIKGSEIYLCGHCKTFYCQRCAKVLKIKGEQCWTCGNEIDLRILEADKQYLVKKGVIEIISEIIEKKESLMDFIYTEKALDDFPQIKKYFFSLLTPEEIDKIDILNLKKEDKIRFIKEYITLSVDKRKKALDDMLQE